MWWSRSDRTLNSLKPLGHWGAAWEPLVLMSEPDPGINSKYVCWNFSLSIFGTCFWNATDNKVLTRAKQIIVPSLNFQVSELHKPLLKIKTWLAVAIL